MEHKRCEQCGIEFVAERSTARFCSAKCRVTAGRSVTDLGDSVTDSVTQADKCYAKAVSVTEPVTLKPIAVTLKDGKIAADIPDFESDLPDCVPWSVIQRYQRPEEVEYRQTIDRLLAYSLAELETASAWIPSWRKLAGEAAIEPERAVLDPERPTSQLPLPANYGQADCQCWMCQVNRKAGSPRIINHGKLKSVGQLLPNELNRLPMPGDSDYAGCCWQGEDGAWHVRKAG